jgi:hypothetical protein
MISGLVEFPGINRMLDIDGRAGFYTIVIVATHKSMKGVILKQPAVAQVASSFVNEYGMTVTAKKK